MTPLVINGFLGAVVTGGVSGFDDKLLNEQVGTVSLNQRPGKGDLRPWRAPLDVAAVPVSPQRVSLYRMGADTASDSSYWLSATAAAHWVRDFDVADTTERTLYTVAGQTPKWTNNVIGLASTPYPTAWRELGVPAPISATLISEATPGTGTEETWNFVHTFVNDLGWESAPSPPSADIVAKPGAVINITALEAAPAGSYGITLRRIYKLQTGASGVANYFFLRQEAIGTTSTTDDGRALGAQLATTDLTKTNSSWLPAPSDGRGLCELWNGMLAMIAGNSVRICLPNKGYAWPLRQAVALAHKPVAIAAWGQRALFLTTGDVYEAGGADPMAIVNGGVKPKRINEPCASERAVVALPNGIAWASPRGLCWFGDNGFANLTLDLIDRDTWAAMNPATMVASQYDGMLFVFYNDGALKGFAIDPLNPTGIYHLSTGYHAAYYDKIAKAMYVLDGGTIKRFDGGAALLSATFKSKRFRFESARSFSAGEVVARNYPVALKVWADDELIVNRSITSDDTFRLPDRDAEEWQVEASTSAGSAQAIRLALSEDALR